LGDAEGFLGFMQARVVVTDVGDRHVLHGGDQAGEGTVFATAVGALPVETVRTLDEARAVEVGRRGRYRVDA
jgi:hypothetical protein